MAAPSGGTSPTASSASSDAGDAEASPGRGFGSGVAGTAAFEAGATSNRVDAAQGASDCTAGV